MAMHEDGSDNKETIIQDLYDRIRAANKITVEGKTFKNPYTILNLKPGATGAEIKGAHRKLAKILHPDLNPSDTKGLYTKFMADINEAYELLDNATIRQLIDRILGVKTQDGIPPQTPDANRNKTKEAQAQEVQAIAQELRGIIEKHQEKPHMLRQALHVFAQRQKPKLDNQFISSDDYKKIQETIGAAFIDSFNKTIDRMDNYDLESHPVTDAEIPDLLKRFTSVFTSIKSAHTDQYLDYQEMDTLQNKAAEVTQTQIEKMYALVIQELLNRSTLKLDTNDLTNWSNMLLEPLKTLYALNRTSAVDYLQANSIRERLYPQFQMLIEKLMGRCKSRPPVRSLARYLTSLSSDLLPFSVRYDLMGRISQKFVDFYMIDINKMRDGDPAIKKSTLRAELKHDHDSQYLIFSDFYRLDEMLKDR